MKNSILYINPLAPSQNISILSETDSTVLETIDFAKHDIASTLPKILGNLYKKYTIKEIWCITWPGPFTLMRVVCLAVNALTFGENITVKGCHLFTLIPVAKNAILELNKDEYLIRIWGKQEEIKKGELKDGTYTGYSTTKDFTEGQTFIEYNEDIEVIRSIFEQLPSVPRLSPLYFKPPKITWSKKST